MCEFSRLPEFHYAVWRRWLGGLVTVELAVLLLVSPRPEHGKCVKKRKKTKR
jgi:hypothetical protein